METKSKHTTHLLQTLREPRLAKLLDLALDGLGGGLDVGLDAALDVVRRDGAREGVLGRGRGGHDGGRLNKGDRKERATQVTERASGAAERDRCVSRQLRMQNVRAQRESAYLIDEEELGVGYVLGRRSELREGRIRVALRSPRATEHSQSKVA